MAETPISSLRSRPVAHVARVGLFHGAPARDRQARDVVPAGARTGGGSSINAMIYARGNPADYDGWAEAGCPGWSHADVLPYFKRPEDNERFHNDYRGSGGPLGVSDPVRPLPISAAFLQPAMARPNLTVRTRALATRVVVESGRTVGVDCGRRRRSELIRAAREVIVSSGAIGSPKLLMLSGIGRAGEWPVVAHIDPAPRRGCLALGEHRYRRVVSVKTPCCQHISLDQIVQRLQRHSARAHLVRQGRHAESYALSGVAVPLPVRRYVLPVLLEEDRRQQVGTRPAARRRVERRRRLGDRLRRRRP